MKKTGLFLFFCMALQATRAQHLPASPIPHLEKQGTATRLLVHGNPFLMLGGELHNSSTSDPGFMRPIWKRMADKHLNTVIAPVSWELIEKTKDQFDFTLVDSMLYGARQQKLHLILIWFGSWKNGASTYVPSWVKKDIEHFPRAKDSSGKSLEILSTFGKASAEADAHAFKMLMKHIRESDRDDQTVLMVQVENEVGVLKANRDYGEAANKAFAAAIPPALAAYLTAHKDKLAPELYAVWKAHGFRTSGSWEEVFGMSTTRCADWKDMPWFTEELFMAWQYAVYVGHVAAAGKEEYPIPMFVNAWLKQPFSGWPGKYPSGGPQSHVMDIWRAGAPAIDLVVPDIYMPYFAWACWQYHRSGNPLLIPETNGGAAGAARAFYAFGQYDAMCFSPFGIDGEYSGDDPISEAYAVLGQMQDLILQEQGRVSMAGILVDTAESVQYIQLAGYRMEARLNGNQRPGMAGGLVICVAPDEFLVAGKGFDLFFTPADYRDLPLIGVDFADEGIFREGRWIARRRLNGDEAHASTFSGTGLKFPWQSYGIQRLKLYRYK
jgi:beta-galactosidase GanA